MDVVKIGSKYYPLYKHLQQREEGSLIITFQEIEGLLGKGLPKSARRKKAFWSNRSKGALQARAWMNAGYHVLHVDFDLQQVKFIKPDISYEVRKDGDTILWNGSMIRALRGHMDVNQAEFSEVLGVRQQTVSEWENQIYQPTRSRSKHLTMVAERAGFDFESQGEKIYLKNMLDTINGTVYNVNIFITYYPGGQGTVTLTALDPMNLSERVKRLMDELRGWK